MSAPQISRPWLKLFAGYNRRYLRRHFHNLRLLRRGSPRLPDGPTVIYLNHGSWWDPLVCLFLAGEFFADRDSFAPIDAAMLERYRFFRRLGFFGIEPRSASGARTFLRTAGAVLSSAHNLLWLTPQGRFADPRERPVRLRPGLGALAAQPGAVSFVPLAIEYSFWTESRPEILVSFGQAITPANEPARSPNEWTALFTRHLEKTQTDLAACAQARLPEDWLVLNHGAAGTNPVFDSLGRLRARLRGKKFSLEHHPQPVR